MFYDGMRASAEAAWRAKLMYFAVYFFGPRWGDSVEATREPFEETDINDLAKLLQADGTVSLDEIERLTQATLRRRVRELKSATSASPLPGSRLLERGKAIVAVSAVSPCN